MNISFSKVLKALSNEYRHDIFGNFKHAHIFLFALNKIYVYLLQYEKYICHVGTRIKGH